LENHPVYHLIRSVLCRQKGEFKEGLDAAKLSIEKLCNNYKRNASKSYAQFLNYLYLNKDKTSSNAELSIRDKSSIYLELAEMFYLNNFLNEAKSTIIDAERIFKDTSEEETILSAPTKLKIFKKI
jgi:hypothetical protein